MAEASTPDQMEQSDIQAQESLAQRVFHLQTLTYLNQIISSSLEINEVLSEIAKATARLMSASIVTIWEVDEAAQVLRIKAFSEERMDIDFVIRKHAFGEGG